MQIQIINTDNKNVFSPIIGERTTELLNRFGRKIEPDELETLKLEAVEILSKCNNPNLHTVQSSTGLAFGYVQSGKTMSFTVLSALAGDNNYRVIIYFAGTKNNLLNQTTKRLRKDLINYGANNDFYKLHENPASKDVPKIKNQLRISSQPTILINVLKNYRHIDNLTKIFKDTQIQNILGNQAVLIIDDEADQASLNGYAYKNSRSEEWEDDEYTTTYSSILNLRNAILNHSYVQYTATPQGPLLISMLDLLSPKHYTVLTPGKKYTGGKTFFRDVPELVFTIPEDQVYNTRRNALQHCPQSLIDAIQLHLIAVAIVVRSLRKEKFLSMMIHADMAKEASRTFHVWAQNLIDIWAQKFQLEDGDLGKEELIKSFEKNYKEAVRLYKEKNEIYPTFEEVKRLLPDIIFDTGINLIISDADAQKDVDWEGSSSHILVGAEMLNRGFTVENLATTYMPRYSVSKSTADTIQQRCRFFGYKLNYLNSCRVYLPEDTIIEYEEYQAYEEEMRDWLKDKKTLDEIEQLIITSTRLNPTRKNVLSAQTVTHKLNGWRKMNAFQAIDENTVFVNKFLSNTEFVNYENYGTPDRNHRFAKLPIKEVISFLSDFKFANMPDATRKLATLRYLKYLSNKSDNPLKHSYIVQMAYAGEPRERTFNEETMRINNVHTGRSTTGTQVYPGDADVKFEDGICIQIHKVKLKSNSIKWGGRVAYTLAIYYPEDFAVNYVANENINII